MNKVCKEIIMDILTGKLSKTQDSNGYDYSMNNYLNNGENKPGSGYDHVNLEVSLGKLAVPVKMAAKNGKMTSFNECWDFSATEISTTSTVPYTRSSSVLIRRFDWMKEYDCRAIYRKLGKEFNYGTYEPINVVSPSALDSACYIRPIYPGSAVYNKYSVNTSYFNALSIRNRISIYLDYMTSTSFGRGIMQWDEPVWEGYNHTKLESKPGLFKLTELLEVASLPRSNPIYTDKFYHAKFSFIPDSGYELLIDTPEPDFYLSLREIQNQYGQDVYNPQP